MNFLLSAGNYWLVIAPIREQAQLLSTTVGQDIPSSGDPNPAPTGSPLANGNAFLADATHNWLPTNDPQLLGDGTWDFSYGIEGTPVPEPSTLIAGALLALPFGLQGFRYLRTRRQA